MSNGSNLFHDLDAFRREVMDALKTNLQEPTTASVTIRWKNDSNPNTATNSTQLLYDNPMPESERRIKYLSEELEKERSKLRKIQDDRTAARSVNAEETYLKKRLSALNDKAS